MLSLPTRNKQDSVNRVEPSILVEAVRDAVAFYKDRTKRDILQQLQLGNECVKG
jgi:hypothetical protein